MTNKERLSEINNVVNKLLFSCSIGTRYVAGRYICVECGARSNSVVTDRVIKEEPGVSVTGAFDYVTHTDDCQFAKLIKLIRGY